MKLLRIGNGEIETVFNQSAIGGINDRPERVWVQEPRPRFVIPRKVTTSDIAVNAEGNPVFVVPQIGMLVIQDDKLKLMLKLNLRRLNKEDNRSAAYYYIDMWSLSSDEMLLSTDFGIVSLFRKGHRWRLKQFKMVK